MSLGRAGAVVAALILVSGCASAEERARDDGARQIRDQLERVQSDLAAGLSTFDPRRDRTISARDATGIGTQVGGGSITYDFGLTATGSASGGLSETAIRTGACFRVIGDRSGGTIEQIGCPRSFRERPDVIIHDEVRVLGSRRTLPEPPEPPYGGCNPSSGANDCPGG